RQGPRTGGGVRDLCTRHLAIARGAGYHRASTRSASIFPGTHRMKAVAYLLGIILIIIAGIYLAVPADSLPSFFPGHEAGLARVRLKHGIASGAVGVILLLIGWFVGRRG